MSCTKATMAVHPSPAEKPCKIWRPYLDEPTNKPEVLTSIISCPKFPDRMAPEFHGEWMVKPTNRPLSVPPIPTLQNELSLFIASITQTQFSISRLLAPAGIALPRALSGLPAAPRLANFRCHQCRKSYGSAAALNTHCRTHGQGCYCPICGKGFSRHWLLQGHLRTHTGEKPFKCSVCHKSFADKSNMRAHLQTHSGVKPWVCPRCGKAFALKSYLSKHQESACAKLDSFQLVKAAANASIALI